MRIILASQSPRRKTLLQQFGIEFEIKPSLVDESSSETNPVKLVEDLAYKKANDIAMRCSNSLVIGADTVVTLNNSILGKPNNKTEASNMLSDLSGKQHQVHTGVVLIQTDHDSKVIKTVQFSEVTHVFFSELDQIEIEDYIATGNPMDKAGSYGIQDDWGATFVKRIEGDFYTVVGLPINRLYYELKKHFPEIIQRRNKKA